MMEKGNVACPFISPSDPTPSLKNSPDFVSTPKPKFQGGGGTLMQGLDIRSNSQNKNV